MEKLHKTIELMFKEIINVNNEHMFLKDTENYKKITDNMQTYLQEIANKGKVPKAKNIPISKLKQIECQYIPTKRLPSNLPKKLIDQINSDTNWNDITDMINEINEYKLPSTIDNAEIYAKKIGKEKNCLNVLILGGGVSGLFLANYINKIYEKSERKVNILLIENRIKNEKYRMPFSRARTFVVSSGEFSFLFKRFFTFIDQENEDKTMISIQIRYLETLLYSLAYVNNIPIYFTKHYNDNNKLLRLIKDGNFSVIFDATGGRYQHNFIHKPYNWTDKYKLKNKDYSLVVDQNNNVIYQTTQNNNYKYYLFHDISTQTGKVVYNECINTDKKLVDDYILMASLDKKCIRIEDLPYVINHFSSNFLKKYFSFLYEKYPNHIIKFYLVEIMPKHVLQVSQIVKIAGKQRLYIGIGDTIMQGHFVIGAGLERLIPFSAKVAHLLRML